MMQREVDRRFQIAEFFSGIVTAAFEYVSVEVALTNEIAQPIRELNLTTGAPLGFR